MKTTKQRIEKRYTVYETIGACILAVLCAAILIGSIEIGYAIKEWLVS